MRPPSCLSYALLMFVLLTFLPRTSPFSSSTPSTPPSSNSNRPRVPIDKDLQKAKVRSSCIRYAHSSSRSSSRSLYALRTLQKSSSFIPPSPNPTPLSPPPSLRSVPQPPPNLPKKLHLPPLHLLPLPPPFATPSKILPPNPNKLLHLLPPNRPLPSHPYFQDNSQLRILHNL